MGKKRKRQESNIIVQTPAPAKIWLKAYSILNKPILVAVSVTSWFMSVASLFSLISLV